MRIPIRQKRFAGRNKRPRKAFRSRNDKIQFGKLRARQLSLAEVGCVARFRIRQKPFPTLSFGPAIKDRRIGPSHRRKQSRESFPAEKLIQGEDRLALESARTLLPESPEPSAVSPNQPQSAQRTRNWFLPRWINAFHGAIRQQSNQVGLSRTARANTRTTEPNASESSNVQLREKIRGRTKATSSNKIGKSC